MHITTVLLTHNITSKMLLPFLQGWSRPEEEKAEKALQKQNKGDTATTSSRIVKPVEEPQEEEAEKSSQKQNKSDASSSVT